MKYLSLAETPDKSENTTSALLVFNTVECPSIAQDECLIKVKAIGVNRADILQKQGKYPAPKGESSILGIEVSGEIFQCGDLVTNWQTGDRVFCIVPGGGYAEYVKVKASHLIKTPEDYSDVEAAACAETLLTAYQSLFFIANADKKQLDNSLSNQWHHENSVDKKQSVLIHAGASGVGSAAIQLAKQAGYYVVTTVSSSEKQQACLSLGADITLNYHEVDFVRWSKEHQPTGYNIIIDVVAGEYLQKNIKVAALDSTIVVLSLLGGRFSDNIDVAKLLLKRITISASTLRNRSDEYKNALVNHFVDDFYSLLEQRKITPLIDNCYQWHQVEQAHQRMENNCNVGKILLTI